MQCTLLPNNLLRPISFFLIDIQSHTFAVIQYKGFSSIIPMTKALHPISFLPILYDPFWYRIQHVPPVHPGAEASLFKRTAAHNSTKHGPSHFPELLEPAL